MLLRQNYLKLVHVNSYIVLTSEVPSAVPVNSIIVYSCPTGEVFEHNKYGEPRWLIRCMDDGQWTTGDFWPKCFNPSQLYYV